MSVYPPPPPPPPRTQASSAHSTHRALPSAPVRDFRRERWPQQPPPAEAVLASQLYSLYRSSTGYATATASSSTTAGRSRPAPPASRTAPAADPAVVARGHRRRGSLVRVVGTDLPVTSSALAVTPAPPQLAISATGDEHHLPDEGDEDLQPPTSAEWNRALARQLSYLLERSPPGGAPAGLDLATAASSTSCSSSPSFSSFLLLSPPGSTSSSFSSRTAHNSFSLLPSSSASASFSSFSFPPPSSSATSSSSSTTTTSTSSSFSFTSASFSFPSSSSSSSSSSSLSSNSNITLVPSPSPSLSSDSFSSVAPSPSPSLSSSTSTESTEGSESAAAAAAGGGGGQLSASEQADIRALYRDLVRREQERQGQRKERKRKWVWEDERLQRKRLVQSAGAAAASPPHHPQQQQHQPIGDAEAAAAANRGTTEEDHDGTAHPTTASELTAAAAVAAAPGSAMADIGAGLQFMREKKLPAAVGGTITQQPPNEEDEAKSEDNEGRAKAKAKASPPRQSQPTAEACRRESDEGEERRKRQSRQEQLAHYQATVGEVSSGLGSDAWLSRGGSHSPSPKPCLDGRYCDQSSLLPSLPPLPADGRYDQQPSPSLWPPPVPSSPQLSSSSSSFMSWYSRHYTPSSLSPASTSAPLPPLLRLSQLPSTPPRAAMEWGAGVIGGAPPQPLSAPYHDQLPLAPAAWPVDYSLPDAPLPPAAATLPPPRPWNSPWDHFPPYL